MSGQRLTDKISFKIMWGIIAVLGSLCIFFIRDWYVETNVAKEACAKEISRVQKDNDIKITKVKERVIILETIIPEIRNFMEKLDNRMRNLERK